MTSATQETVRAVLRERGPLPLDRLLEQVLARQPLATKDPRQTVRNVLLNDPLCEQTLQGDGVYLPSFVRGASVWLNTALVAPAKRLLAVDAEAFELLWVGSVWDVHGPTPHLALEGGPTVTVQAEVGRGLGNLHFVLRLPPPFWRWWEERQHAGADALLLCCTDGEGGRYDVRAQSSGTLDVGVVAAANAAVRAAAAAILRRRSSLRADELARKLLATGVYHRAPPPDPLSHALLTEPTPFCWSTGGVSYRPDLTPALRRLFAPRLEEERWWQENMVHELLGLPPLPAPASAPVAAATLPPLLAPRLYRIRLRLQWRRRVWRVVELLGEQTLEDLHLAIQRAFGWDNDHLYAFYLTGRQEHLTEVAAPMPEDAEPPTADDVSLAALDLRPGQRFLYVFDFGDNLRHDIEVLDVVPAPAHGDFPRLVESYGAAPPQYPLWEEA